MATIKLTASNGYYAEIEQDEDADPEDVYQWEGTANLYDNSGSELGEYDANSCTVINTPGLSIYDMECLPELIRLVQVELNPD